MFGHGKHGGGGFGFGPPWMRHGMRGGGWGPWGMLRDLDLTDEQLEKLAELKMDGINRFAQLRSTMSSLIHQMGKELAKDQIDKAKVKEIAQQIKTHRSEFGDRMLDRLLEFSEVLTAEQRKKMRLKLIKRFLGVDARCEDSEQH